MLSDYYTLCHTLISYYISSSYVARCNNCSVLDAEIKALPCELALSWQWLNIFFQVNFNTHMSYGSKPTAKPTESSKSVTSAAFNAATGSASTTPSAHHHPRRTHLPTQQFYSAQSARRNSRNHSPLPSAPNTPTVVTPVSMSASFHTSHSSSAAHPAASQSLHHHSFDTLSTPVHQFLKGIKLHKYYGLLKEYSLVEVICLSITPQS